MLVANASLTKFGSSLKGVADMKITSVSVTNYKSLRDVCWEPEYLTVLIGANASGKSNLADFHDFLSDLYEHGLSVAVARKGGYENIAHRKMRRSRGAISVTVKGELRLGESRISRTKRPSDDSPELRFSHSFSFRAEGQAIDSSFKIEEENFSIELLNYDNWISILEIERRKNSSSVRRPNSKVKVRSKNSNLLKRQREIWKYLDNFVDIKSLPKDELVFGVVSRFDRELRYIASNLSSIRVFQLSTTDTRKFGVPIPNPEMDIHGGNLPAVVDLLLRKHEGQWEKIFNVMCEILPNLEKIEVGYTHTRTLGLFFYEEGIGRPWSEAEVSDGTIHCLAFLVAIYDPRTRFLIIEEPENSIHTWILRQLMKAAIEASDGKQIIFTTHSKTVIDSISPKCVWVLWREDRESRLAKVESLFPDIIDMVQTGDMSSFEILDTGVVLEAVPPF